MTDLHYPDCPIPFAGSHVDFAETERGDASLDRLQGHAGATAILLHRGQVATDGADLLRARPAEVAALPLADPGLIFLGLEGDGDPVFAASLKSDEMFPAGALTDLRLQGHRLAPDALAVAGRARSIFDWHRTHPFCARCGRPSVPAEGGAKRICTACDAEHFPRVNPVVIFLVEQADAVLLGRGPGWPPGYYSALAGFVSPGETIEEAATREGMEEVGATLACHRYLFCQPWPFPSQLMIGLISQAADRTVRIDEKELEDARWFSRAEVQAVFDGTGGAFLRPPRTTIAHQLMKAWLAGQ
ncbi:NAD(+) diphosphatase [uncultured Algimonas sp.]|uniref:NAD(+) diphosphatase n=1 Tax=uncultured Algimonas sp. TaxID=1547920 RepID=UPI002631BBA0|nr:NAD(+) diphosphatase [uncultured Algimonas sp.]